ncbi:MAG: orotate phosphoribosyltransferase [Candidatus Peregrinibacteria bacterium Gr01-1014_25]|nr:MAG: orotate phosphoribosyltransferase [Candidatus Peregrinibacteria bacterium Gr01-1014_25]
MPHAKRIAEFLLDIGAVKLSPQEPFTWTSGLKSPIYCDNRMVYSHPQARTFVVKALAERVRALHIPPDVIAGTATAAIGWAALVADKLDLPFVYVRAKSKEHGMGKQIEGDLPRGRHVVVVEDLLSTGGSAAATVQALRGEGQCVVTDVVSIMSYEFIAAREKAMELAVHLHPLTTVTTLLDVAQEQGRLSPSDVRDVVQFVREPERWR